MNRKRWIEHFAIDERRLIIDALELKMKDYRLFQHSLPYERMEALCKELRASLPSDNAYGREFAERFAEMIGKRPATRRRQYCGIWTPRKPKKPIMIGICDTKNKHEVTFYRCLWYRLGWGNRTYFGISPIGERLI